MKLHIELKLTRSHIHIRFLVYISEYIWWKIVKFDPRKMKQSLCYGMEWILPLVVPYKSNFYVSVNSIVRVLIWWPIYVVNDII